MFFSQNCCCNIPGYFNDFRRTSKQRPPPEHKGEFPTRKADEHNVRDLTTYVANSKQLFGNQITTSAGLLCQLGSAGHCEQLNRNDDKVLQCGLILTSSLHTVNYKLGKIAKILV